MKTRVNTGPFSNLLQYKNVIIWLVYVLSTILVLVLQSAPRFFPSIFGIRPFPLVPYVICVAVFGGARTGATVGLLSGLLWGVFSTHVYGFDALVLMLFGLVAGLLVEWFLRANFYTALVLCASATVAYCLLEWLCCFVFVGRANVWATLFTVLLPNGVYTVILIPLVFLFTLAIARFVRRWKSR